jgi:hypothetical protein
MVTESSLLPGDYRPGLDEYQGIEPASPKPKQPPPEHSFGPTEAWAINGRFVDRQLMPQRKVFRAQRCLGPAEARNEGQQG